ncbi:uncharacterized protein [Amphiura filiformis]|uniref:uncharacterized protein n=1 Tax=Amphiura filiformis TaxID=82378 RepID=UPI003B2279EB
MSMSTATGDIVRLVDTPGLFDTRPQYDNKMTLMEQRKCILYTSPGPYAFLIVINATKRATDDVQESLKILKQAFGDKIDEIPCQQATKTQYRTKTRQCQDTYIPLPKPGSSAVSIDRGGLRNDTDVHGNIERSKSRLIYFTRSELGTEMPMCSEVPIDSGGLRRDTDVHGNREQSISRVVHFTSSELGTEMSMGSEVSIDRGSLRSDKDTDSSYDAMCMHMRIPARIWHVHNAYALNHQGRVTIQTNGTYFSYNAMYMPDDMRIPARIWPS